MTGFFLRGKFTLNLEDRARSRAREKALRMRSLIGKSEPEVQNKDLWLGVIPSGDADVARGLSSHEMAENVAFT